MADFRIYEGDCIEQMRTIPDASVNCCVTSPPYYGLRDYGTGKWEGGDPACSHKRDSKQSDKTITGHANMGGAVGDGIYKDVCPRCGAIRHDRQIGLEQTPEAFIAKLVEVFREVKRVLKDDGTLWVNIGDSYSGSGKGPAGNLGKEHDERNMEDLHSAIVPSGTKPKDLIGIPWMLAFALRADGWYLRQDIIWHKPNPMPESVTDRCTKAHEYIFLLSKSRSYYFDNEAIKTRAHPDSSNRDRDAEGKFNNTPGRTRMAGLKTNHYEWANKRSVWSVNTRSYKEAHFATYPPELIEPCILAGCPPAGKRCDCNEIIATPTGSVEEQDPSIEVGRAGMSRPRNSNEGTRNITRLEQRHHAEQMRSSPHRETMEKECGSAFEHYIRTDKSGARPLPENIRIKFKELGWITDAPMCNCPIYPAGTVLDPFGGSGTTAEVALTHGRNAILCELNPEYIALMKRRLSLIQPNLI